MKMKFNKKVLILGILGLVFAGVFLAKSYANKNGGYEIDLGVKIKSDEEMVKASNRQVAYWKVKEDGMGPWDIMRLAKDCDEMSFEEISKKFGSEPKYSEKSQLFFGDKAYDQMTSAMYEKNKSKVKEKIKMKNLEEGPYLIKETDQSFKESGAKERLRTRIEYVGKESAPEGILDLGEE
ncbi:hypothetical protein [uncultured Anaerococcus sp.]|uniref:hypothetical protein n=1 Tax=uncultured Anaerococcus sp. TaxID=293428 RepID=UPI0028064906|nr:hypothetical protein [uncultured Anaerococcus sp.]